MDSTQRLNILNKDIMKTLDLKSENIVVEINNRIEQINNEFAERPLFKAQHMNLEYYGTALETISPSYEFYWTKDTFFPYMNEHSYETLLLLEMLTLLYVKSFYEMILSDLPLFEKISRPEDIYRNPHLHFDKVILEKISEENDQISCYFMVFRELLNDRRRNEFSLIKGEDSEIYVSDVVEYYITHDMWNNISNKLIKDIQQPIFYKILDCLIGQYQNLFNVADYFKEYQPLIFKCTLDSLANFKELLKYTRK